MYEEENSHEEELRTFTVSEARSLIPRLRKLLARMARERDRLDSMRDEIDLARQNADRNGGSKLGIAYLAHVAALSEALHDIQRLGVQVKDLREGLVDFPHERHGRIVYLCWKPDEEELRWWHEVDAGFAGRQPLTDELE
jgi:hypothetical protein